jgi:NAD(P)-dependent dehydrogenase (short-subunit alcohol dehydrogenase family)
VLDANVRSVFLYAKQRDPAPARGRRRRDRHVSSALGLVGGDDDFATHAYATSKAALIGLTRAMA